MAACKKGIPVLLEKPIAEDARQGSRLLEASHDFGTPVLVGYVLRYSECLNVAKRLLDQGLIGSPVSFQIMLGAYDTLVVAKNRFCAWDRNKLFSDYSHEWDYLQWWLGLVRRSIAPSHQSGQLELTQYPNVVDGILELRSGVSGTFHFYYVQSPGRRQFVLVGDQGTLDIDVVRGHVVLSRRGEDYIRHYVQIEHRDTMMEKQHDLFLEVIRKNAAPKGTIEDGVQALDVADALICSAQNGSWESLQGMINLNHMD